MVNIAEHRKMSRIQVTCNLCTSIQAIAEHSKALYADFQVLGLKRCVVNEAARSSIYKYCWLSAGSLLITRNIHTPNMKAFATTAYLMLGLRMFAYLTIGMKINTSIESKAWRTIHGFICG